MTSLTGSDSSNSVNIPKGFAARIDAQNAAGGVNGRKITYVVEDDASSPTTAATAAETAVNAGAFAVDYNSPFAFGAIKYLTAAGIPVVGGAYDGPEWSEPQTFPQHVLLDAGDLSPATRCTPPTPSSSRTRAAPGWPRSATGSLPPRRDRQGHGSGAPPRSVSRRPTSTAPCRSARST